MLIFLLLMVAQPVMAGGLPFPLTEGVQPKKSGRAYDVFDAIESPSLRISLNDSLNGFVEGKACDFCKVIRLRVTPETKAYENNIEVPLKNAESRLGRYAAVFYLIKTKKVTEIRW